MKEMEQVESTEGKGERAKKRGISPQTPLSEEQEHASEHERVVEQHLKVECNAQRKQTVEKKMEGMVHGGRAIALQVITAEDVGAPVKAFVQRQTLRVKRPERQVTSPKVIEHEHLPAQQRKRHDPEYSRRREND